jgi:DivIVA domain-containing protein
MSDEPRAAGGDAPAPLTPEAVAGASFGSSLRGYNHEEVRAFLARVAQALREVRLAEGTQRARAEAAEARVGKVDEEDVTRYLGEEAVGVLNAAREAAADMRAKAEEAAAQARRIADEDAARLRGQAEDEVARAGREASEEVATLRRDAADEVARLRSEAESHAASVTLEAAEWAERARVEAEREADRIRAEAAELAANELEIARQEGREVVSEAQASRQKVLADLDRRRRVGRVQLEQLKAGRDRLLDAYRVVRRTLDEVTAELEVAVDEARAAADAAAKRADGSMPLPSILDETAEAAPIDMPLSEVVVPDVAIVPAPTDAPIPAAAPPPVPPVAPSAVFGTSVVDRITIRSEAPVPPSPPPMPPESIVEREPEPPEPAEAPPPDAVDQLFAKLKEDRKRSVTSAHEVLARDDDATGEVPVQAGPPTVGVAAPGGPPTAERVADAAPVDLAAGDTTALERRDAVVDEIEQSLARRLKRLLADEQNELLDRLRRLHANGVDAVLPPAAEQLTQLTEVATPELEQAVAAGARFLSTAGTGNGSSPSSASPADAVPAGAGELAAELASALAAPLRQRIAATWGDKGGDEEALADGVRACYREWKGHRIADVARHFVLAAFNRGLVTAVPAGTCLRWIVDNGGTPCPDAEDNALAGLLVKGEPFPTGDLHPPAHPGCRCLVLPERPADAPAPGSAAEPPAEVS